MSPLSVPARRPVARRLVALAAAAAAALASLAPAAVAAPGNAGFLTSQPSMLVKVRGDVEIMPILTVGETLPGGYRFEAIPDGISLRTRGDGRVDLYVNHETSTVPFPYVPAAPTTANSWNDFDNSQLSRLILSQRTAGVLYGSFVIDGSANYQRFCSNFMAGPEQGFDRYIVFTNEEAVDTVNRTGTAWPATGAFGSDPEQPGVVVAYDVRTGQYRSIYGMGRHNHENSVAIPGYDQLVLLSGDDTFTSFPPASQFYMYLASDTDAVWDDQGALYAFKADPSVDGSPAFLVDGTTPNPLVGDDYYDVGFGDTLTGTFIPVPPGVARGDQAALETWSDTNGVFQFHRIEDVAYDRNDPRVVYLADSGRASSPVPYGETIASTNGRLWKMVLDDEDPTIVESLTIMFDHDVLGLKDPSAIHQPDNLETTANSLLIQEDPSSGNQFSLSVPDARATTARIWRYDFDTETLEIVAAIDQSADASAANQRPDKVAKPAALGNWESSGVVDASTAFGPGAFLIDVQAHSYFIEVANGPDLIAPTGPDWLYKREGGQLLLIRIPGA